ncbi:hypothetical protein L228DRAFT_263417 [Xylona heveae TC161]|uniref:COP9 signalosome complex subunit 3 N-terminal helical repeats domain-containing protein n=1 Tax=Xylona heveae (strain CBS 132557 / TC161) TaxID=1328760 RepID=A0A165A991_XYLHT|nr:hypothetical protein L228DRAFT_263417 [Xylona heveae TC161]KZF20120.1 hypothetical protein L228DRAFT_263417 [Xylona heveae TC161]
MEALLSQLLAFPPHPPPTQPLPDAEYEKQIKTILQILNQTPANLLLGGVAGGGDLLNVFVPSRHTIPYLYTLLAHIHAVALSPEDSARPGVSLVLPDWKLWPKIVEFLEQFDPIQVRYAGLEWRRVLETATNTAIYWNNPAMAIDPVQTAILRLDPTASTYTSNHNLFAQLCLLGGSYPPALPVIDNIIRHFPDTPEDYIPSVSIQASINEIRPGALLTITTGSGLTGAVTYQEFLQYSLWCAQIYIGLRQWEKAEITLASIIMAPVDNAVSNLMVIAYKRWVLVRLLSGGDAKTMPRATSHLAAKAYRAAARHYDVLVDTYFKGSIDELIAEIEAGKEIWQTDSNEGLTLELLESRRRYAIIKLEEIYSALSLEEVGQLTSALPADPARAQEYILSLIRDRHLNASLECRDSKPPATSNDGLELKQPSNTVLCFASDSTTGPLAVSEEEQFQELQETTARVLALADQVKEMDVRMSLRKDFVDFSRRSRRGMGTKDQPGSGPEPPWEEMPMDEDLMEEY